MSILIKKFQAGRKLTINPDTVIHEGLVTKVPENYARDREEIITDKNGNKIRRVYHSIQSNEPKIKQEILTTNKPPSTTPFDPIAYDKTIKQKLSEGVPLQDLVNKGLISTEIAKKYIPFEVKRDVYTDEPIIEKPKNITTNTSKSIFGNMYNYEQINPANQNLANYGITTVNFPDENGVYTNSSRNAHFDKEGKEITYDLANPLKNFQGDKFVPTYTGRTIDDVRKTWGVQKIMVPGSDDVQDKGASGNFMMPGTKASRIAGGGAGEFNQQNIANTPDALKSASENYQLKKYDSQGKLITTPTVNKIQASFKRGGTIIMKLPKESLKKGGKMIKKCMCGSPLYKKKSGGTIYIKPENKGKFTATKKTTGKSTEELTHSKNPLTRKRAIFAQNAKKWNHSKK